VVLVPGAMVGTYRVVNKLGEGGMGTVYLGEHTLLGRPAAIKVLQPSLATSDEVVARFFNEARAVTRIADPGIVQVFDFGHQTEVGAFIVMELLEGESMDGRLRRTGAVGVIETVRLARLICGSLGAAHAKGIVHRDLKPENLFIVKDPGVPGGERPKILDFGIAKLAGDEPGVIKTRTGALMGTPMYMSPEQCSGSSVVDHRSDIYSIGCVMFAMLTGRPPFHGPGAGDLIAAHLREPAPLAASRVPGLPGAIDGILQRCLTKSPDGRFQSMAELAQHLAAVEHALLASDAVIPAARGSDRFARAATPGLGAQNPTPGPGLSATPAPAWSGTNRSNPTTLGEASGQASARMRASTSAPPSRRQVAVAVTAVLALVGGVAGIVSWRGGKDGGQRVETADAPLPAPASDPARAPLPAPDASAAPASTIADAGIADAPPPPPAVDAAIAQPHKPGAGAHHSTGGDHAGSAGSAARPRIDRSD
jgi:serine/threonine protein kinase